MHGVVYHSGGRSFDRVVYVNTLMLQRVLAEPVWTARMTSADGRGLAPLVWAHVSPTWSSGSTSNCGRRPDSFHFR